MAGAPRNRLPSGYDEDFVNAIEDEVLCLKCHLPLREPVLTRCGHRFCKECLEEHFRRQGSHYQPLNCPINRKGLDRDRDVFPDKATERKILSLAIKCPSEGCELIGELRNKEVHLASCLFKLVPCTNKNCYVIVQRRHLEEHVIFKCPWRILECDHCSEPHPACKMKDHNEKCSKFPVICPNSCGVRIVREMIANHTENDCPLTMTSCPYEQMGCEKKIQRREVESHLQFAISRHFYLACMKINTTEAKLNETQAKLNSTEVRLHKTELKLNDMQETTRKLMEKLDKLEKLEKKTKKDKGNTIETKEVMKVKHEPSNFPQVFVWKIINFSEILRQAKSGEEILKIETTPFYSERYGYKLKVGMHPNGYGSFKNTHLAVFIAAMKGEYDAILPWPFKKKVTLTLIDQQEDLDERQNVFGQIDPDNKPDNFVRPIHHEENPGWGIAGFISHDQLYSRCYLVDDTLFLQIEIDS